MWQINKEQVDFYTQVSKINGTIKVQKYTDNYYLYLEDGKNNQVTFQEKSKWTTKEVDYLPHEFMGWVA